MVAKCLIIFLLNEEEAIRSSSSASIGIFYFIFPGIDEKFPKSVASTMPSELCTDSDVPGVVHGTKHVCGVEKDGFVHLV